MERAPWTSFGSLFAACGLAFVEFVLLDLVHAAHVPRKKIAGAIAYCEKRKLYKKCLYEGCRKYLVLMEDRVEVGDEKIRELEELAEAAGLLL